MGAAEKVKNLPAAVSSGLQSALAQVGSGILLQMPSLDLECLQCVEAVVVCAQVLPGHH